MTAHSAGLARDATPTGEIRWGHAAWSCACMSGCGGRDRCSGRGNRDGRWIGVPKRFAGADRGPEIRTGMQAGCDTASSWRGWPGQGGPRLAVVRVAASMSGPTLHTRKRFATVVFTGPKANRAGGRGKWLAAVIVPACAERSMAGCLRGKLGESTRLRFRCLDGGCHQAQNQKARARDADRILHGFGVRNARAFLPLEDRSVTTWGFEQTSRIDRDGRPAPWPRLTGRVRSSRKFFGVWHGR